MRVQILGTVVSVSEREYTRKDGTSGKARKVVFSANGYTLEDEFYLSDTDWDTLGVKPGVDGKITIQFDNKEKTSREGKPFQVKEWKFADFKLSNANNQPQPQPAVAPSTPLPETPAPQEAQVQGTDLPY